jgi:putative glutamine amidotransferase
MPKVKPRPVILVAPGTQRKGAEFADASISLSKCYTEAIIAGGGLPLVMPATTSRPVIEECLQRCAGVLMTGGDDIDPRLYTKDLDPALAKTLGPVEPERDAWEKELLAGIFEERKPLLAICRGQQMLNVALGGTLLVDIASQVPGALNHRRLDRKTEPVHDVTIAPDSALARITSHSTLAVNSTHHQAIGEIAKPLRAVAQTADGVIEAVELQEPDGMPWLLAVQFHPERLIDRNGVFLQLFTSFIEACAAGRRTNL